MKGQAYKICPDCGAYLDPEEKCDCKTFRPPVFDVYNAIDAIYKGIATKLEVNENVKAYKVPSNNPNKYTIRIDITVNT